MKTFLRNVLLGPGSPVAPALRPLAPLYRALRGRRLAVDVAAPVSAPPATSPEPVASEPATPAGPSLIEAADKEDVIGVGKAASGRNVVMLVVSDLRIDPRVEREARALASAGYAVTVICPDPTQGTDPGLTLDWGAGVDIQFIHWSAASFVMGRPGFMAEMLFQSALEAAERLQPLAFHAHDLNTGLAGLAAARLTGAHFIADFHEWTSENVHWDAEAKGWAEYPADWKAELQALEARIMAEASAVVTVCDSIADAIAVELGQGRRPVVIRNIPAISLEPTRPYPPLKEQLGLPEDRFVLLWQGGTGTTRLIEPIIEALAFAPQCTFVIRGPSLDLFGEGYKEIAARIGASDRLILLPPVPSQDVVASARGADAGVWTLPRFCRNFTFALPNKIFEYIAAGLPIIVAHYPEARRIVETYALGADFDPYDPQSIALAINRMIDDREFAQSCRENTAKALVELDADHEWTKLSALYDQLPRTPARASAA